MNGDKALVIFRGAPYPRQVHWTGEGYADCSGDGCEDCAADSRSFLRVGLTVTP